MAVIWNGNGPSREMDSSHGGLKQGKGQDIRLWQGVRECLGGAVNVLLSEGTNPRTACLGVRLDDHEPSLKVLPSC